MGGFSPQLPEWASWSQTKRHQEASRLLSAAGYAKHKPLQFTLLYNNSELHKQLAVAVSTMWQKTLGAKVTLRNEEAKVFLNSLHINDFQIARNGRQANYAEPSALLNKLLSHNPSNFMLYQSQAFEQWMNKALRATHEAERFQSYQQAEAQLAHDMPMIPLYHYVTVRLVKPYVKGLSTRNSMNTIYIKDLYIIRNQKSENGNQSNSTSSAADLTKVIQ